MHHLSESNKFIMSPSPGQRATMLRGQHGYGLCLPVCVCAPHANDVTTFASKLSPHQKVAARAWGSKKWQEGGKVEREREREKARERERAEGLASFMVGSLSGCDFNEH